MVIVIAIAMMIFNLKPSRGNPVKLRVIEGRRREIEEKVLRDMLKGDICDEDLLRLERWGKLYLVVNNLPAIGSGRERPAESVQKFATPG